MGNRNEFFIAHYSATVIAGPALGRQPQHGDAEAGEKQFGKMQSLPHDSFDDRRRDRSSGAARSGSEPLWDHQEAAGPSEDYLAMVRLGRLPAKQALIWDEATGRNI